ncbi:hypothetical protein [Pedobacter sp. ASV28]|uniref:hypothetical protein n=1 Tax=Pedobacter sp. ASV28 TaxID=2795123 RepID=UPI0018ED9EFD|nr:hypothetical protein [Pedobacter sp. ASV28]
MSTQTLIISTIILATIIIAYQLYVFKSFRKQTKDGRKHDSGGALGLFFKMSPFRSFFYNLFLKDKIQPGKKRYRAPKTDETEDEV